MTDTANTGPSPLGGEPKIDVEVKADVTIASTTVPVPYQAPSIVAPAHQGSVARYRSFGRRRGFDDAEDSLLEEVIDDASATSKRGTPPSEYAGFIELLARHAERIERAASRGEPRANQIVAVFRSVKNTPTKMVEPMCRVGMFALENWLNDEAIRSLPAPD